LECIFTGFLGTMVVLAASCADNAVRFLNSLPPEQRADSARLLIVDATLLMEPEERPPCAAGRYLQRTCVFSCVFAPHIQTDDDLVTFASVTDMFSADLVADLLHGWE
jgi:hypothetical protein